MAGLGKRPRGGGGRMMQNDTYIDPSAFEELLLEVGTGILKGELLSFQLGHRSAEIKEEVVLK